VLNYLWQVNIISKAETIIDIFLNNVSIFSEKPVFEILQNKKELKTVTYKEFHHEVNNYMNKFHFRGICKNDKVIMLIRPNYEFYIIMVALMKLGAIPILLEPTGNPKNTAKVLSQIKAKIFIGIPLACIFKIIFKKYFKDIKIWITSGKYKIFGCIPICKLKNKNQIIKKINLNKTDTAIISFTTGSTGEPKGACYSHLNLMTMYNILKNNYKIKDSDRNISTFPAFNMFDMAFGITTTLINVKMNKKGKLTPVNLLNIIISQNITLMFASPNLLNQLCDYNKNFSIKTSKLKKIIAGGAPLPPETIKKINKTFNNKVIIYNTYGATEALQISLIKSDEIIKDTYSKTLNGVGTCVGYVFPEIKIKIIKITNQIIEKWNDNLEKSQNEIGEIIVYGDNVSLSYYNNLNANLNQKILINNKIWHRTGDIGRIDNENRLWYYGRKCYIVKTKKHNIYTSIEAIFNKHSFVKKSVLIGIDKNNHQVPIICIKKKHGISRKKLEKELKEIAFKKKLTKNIKQFVFYPNSFPVDIRHRSKINRDIIKRWYLKKYEI
jgi:acyl-CoA synthetase (AMP-forming)/AMP-acid ligase II